MLSLMLVCVCVTGDIDFVNAHTTHTTHTQKHGSPHLDDVRLSSQPAVSPLPAGVSPFSWEILSFPVS